jgi:hypothetical protein
MFRTRVLTAAVVLPLAILLIVLVLALVQNYYNQLLEWLKFVVSAG